MREICGDKRRRITISNSRTNSGKNKEEGGDELGNIGLYRSPAKGIVEPSKGNGRHLNEFGNRERKRDEDGEWAFRWCKEPVKIAHIYTGNMPI